MKDDTLLRKATPQDIGGLQVFCDRVSVLLEEQAAAGVSPDMIINGLISLATNLIVQAQPITADPVAIKGFEQNLRYFRSKKCARDKKAQN